jgi:hypothetical protein
MRAQVILLILFMSTISFAAPTITDVVANPYVWLGEDELITLTCSDISYNISSVYTDTTGPNITLPRLYFNGTNNNYSLLIDKLYLDRTGTFNPTIKCMNENNETATHSMSIDVYQISGTINNITPGNIYSDDVIEIDFSLKKNNLEITSGVSFNVSVDDNNIPLKIAPAYDANKGWILIIDPLQAGNHELVVNVFYDRTSASAQRQITVGQNVYFVIESIDSIYPTENSNVSFTLVSMEKGSVIELSKNNLNIQIGPTTVDIKEITRTGDKYRTRVLVPPLSYGTYSLKATLSHVNGTYSDSREVVYRMPVSGKLVDSNNKAISAQIKFLSGSIEKSSISTDGVGSYSGYILPGTYDVQITFPQSTLYLDDSTINSFNDPIKYNYITDVKVPGIVTTGIYVYEVGLPFYKAIIDFSYNEKNIQDENDIKILKCYSWNSGRNACTTNWTEVFGEIDSVRNTVRLNMSNLSAFAFGTREKIEIEYAMEKQKYYLKEPVRMRGVTWNSNHETIEGVSLEIYNKNVPINYTALSDANGVFLFEFLVPSTEGNYTLKLSAKKPPYINSSKDINIEVVRNRDVTIISKDSFQISEGESVKEEISLTNTGQADLTNVTISIEGIPEYYVLSPKNIENIAINEEKVIELHLFAPLNASLGTYSGKIIISSNEITKEKIFGFTVLGINQQNNTVPTTGFSIGLPQINLDANIYVLIFAAVCFAFAYMLKNRKKNRKTNNYNDTLSDIKFFLVKQSQQQETANANGDIHGKDN